MAYVWKNVYNSEILVYNLVKMTSIVQFYTIQLVFYTVDAAHNGIRHPVVIINLINLFHLPILLLLQSCHGRTRKFALKKVTRTCWHISHTRTIYFTQGINFWIHNLIFDRQINDIFIKKFSTNFRKYATRFQLLFHYQCNIRFTF